ncbi:hypothetical protein HMI55_002909 [Coelomomyces lativittatus]|nr:hypothetical protein HMI55_002909 [Coelomomyces lativittatus]
MPNAQYPYLNHGTAPISSIDDAGRFQLWQQAMHTLGLSKKLQLSIFKLLAAILHLGHVQFTQTTTSESSHAVVKNTDALAFVANLLEVDMYVLEATLTTTLKYNPHSRDMVTELLTPQKAKENRDALATLLYHALFMWTVEFMNQKIMNLEEAVNFIGIVDFPGRASSNPNNDATSSSLPSTTPSFHDPISLQWTYCNEQLEDFFLQRLFNYGNAQLREQGLNVPDAGYHHGQEAAQYLSQLPSLASFSTSSSPYTYPGQFVHLFRGGQAAGGGGSRVPLFQALFGQTVLDMQAFDAYGVALIKAPVLRPKPLLAASDAKSNYNKLIEMEVLVEQMHSLIDALWKTSIKVMYCFRPNLDIRLGSTSLDLNHMVMQSHRFQLSALVRYLTRRFGANYNVRMEPSTFFRKYGVLLENQPQAWNTQFQDPRSFCAHFRQLQHMSEHDFFIGSTLIFLRDEAFWHLEKLLKLYEMDKLPPELLGQMDLEDDASDMSEVGSSLSDGVGGGASSISTNPLDPSSLRSSSTLKNVNPADPFSQSKQQFTKESSHPSSDKTSSVPTPSKTTFSRRIWVMLTWTLTWWIPSFLLSSCGGMKRDDIRMAWREKVAIFFLILFCCAVQLFFIIGLGQLVCPRQNILNLSELYYKSTDEVPLVGIYGGIYDLNYFFSRPYHSSDLMRSFGGFDITAGFPRTPAYYCEYAKKNNPNFPSLYNNQTTIANGTYIQTRHRLFYDRDLFGAQRLIDYSLKLGVKKLIGWDPNTVKSLSTSTTNGRLRKMFIVKDRVYDLQPYADTLGDAKQDFFPSGLMEYLNGKPGIDLTQDSYFMKAWQSDASLRQCFNNLFVVGVVDYRKSAQCLFSNYVLVSFSALLALIIVSKFFAALQLSSPGTPEEHDKFVILQVPCYTENEDSLRKTIDSLATLDYDDKRKLLLLVCDGNIMGSGNDRPTPRIVLDILGIPSSTDPPALAFQSIGEGSKQYNMGKVYSGLYGVQGHLVPYLVVVKVGMPNEMVRPGNRGKRDSQMILMRFLNKVCFDAPMSPLELDIYHHIKNVIGVNPAFYEYCLMVDADTVVHPDSLIRLVSVMMHDTKVMGVCGETKLANEKDTWATMIQVYEYFISHHMAKAFESLFGSVTCLPGCFCMYRLRSPNRNSPLLVSNALIQEYGNCNVDTLHKKNLLSLGEDRFLTTLMLKNFPNMRTVFTADAKCETMAPERWSVLLSQRRRWINSTVHNLMELLNISQLCGFCLFSMRFVVFIDLIATLVQPAVVVYLGYLLYMVVASSLKLDNYDFPMISLILLGVIYGLQAIIFLIKREWQHIGWMLIYLLAVPVFSFFIPLYSFWHMDDFTWGNTRRVLGEKKQGSHSHSTPSDEGMDTFDITKIPHRKWSEYEAEKLKQNTVVSSTSKQDSSFNAMMEDTRSTSGRSVKSRRHDRSDRLERQNNGTGTVISSSSRSFSPSSDPRRQVSSPQPRFPSDLELFKEIESILATADLMTTTKKQVRDKLTAHFRVDLTPKRDFINNSLL